MFFYQQTTDTITQEQLIIAILDNHSLVHFQKLYFKGYPHIQTLPEALQVIDEKRKTLTNPTRHSFLCIEMEYEDIKDNDRRFSLSTHVADSINSFFNNDLFIVSLLYQDEQNISHSLIIISDIEKSLEKTSSFYLETNLLHQIIAGSLADCSIENVCYKSLYLFNGKDAELAYDGVIHVNCLVQSENK